jgi:hypothetical protein
MDETMDEFDLDIGNLVKIIDQDHNLYRFVGEIVAIDLFDDTYMVEFDSDGEQWGIFTARQLAAYVID